MKSLLAAAIVLLASGAAHAQQYQFEYGGRTIRVDPDRGTVSIPGVYDNTGQKSKRTKTDRDSSHSKSNSQDAKTDPQPAPSASPAPADTAAAPPAPAPAAPPPAATTAAPNPPTTSDTAALPPPSPPPPPNQPVQQQAVQQPPAAPPPAPAAPPQPAVAAVAPPPAQPSRDPNSPVGVWFTEQKEGKVRIEQCGANLCGYSVEKSNANGKQILINMKPGQGKWSGRILDPNSGSTYDSTIALKGPDTLRVQGCAFGGMMCGGQTWTRVN